MRKTVIFFKCIVYIIAVISFNIFFSACSQFSIKDIFKRPKPTEKQTKKVLKTTKQNQVVLSTTPNKAWDATLKSINWIKWQPFLTDKESGTLVLKEAYVYKKEGSLTRMYYWPPKEYIMSSDMSDYIKTISNTYNGELIRNIVFTQENMRISLSQFKGNKVKISIDYKVFPYYRTLKLGNQLKSNNYIEGLLIDKIKKNLQK